MIVVCKIGELGIEKDDCHDENSTDWVCFFHVFNDYSGLLFANHVHNNHLNVHTF